MSPVRESLTPVASLGSAHFLGEALLTPFEGCGPLGNGSICQAHQRGQLELNQLSRPPGPPFLSYGPNTPPPGDGDWIIDSTGNNVNNTTILLNGNLNVTTGELTLDNVTLIINCTTDGQYGINVSAEGTLNVTNCDITAFNGSLHYKFAVYGNMTMDRCDVSEMWGDPARLQEGGGVAIFSNVTRILSSTISNGETSGIQVHGSAGPEITDTNVSENGRNGFITLDYASPKIQGCLIQRNNGNGIAILDSSSPTFTDCTSNGSNWKGIDIAGNSTPEFLNCTSSGSNQSGIVIFENSIPVFTNCTSSGSNGNGIETQQNSAPRFINCTSSDSSLFGFESLLNSTPTFENCTSTGNGRSGIAAWDNSTPKFTNSTSANNSGNGIQVTDLAQPEFTNCTFTGNNWSGIAAWDNSTPKFTNSTVTNNSGHGIQVTDLAQPELTNCTSMYNFGNGAGIYGDSEPVFTNCTFENNSLRGILIGDSSHPRIMNCTIKDNHVCGIDVFGTAYPQLLNCTSDNNRVMGIHILDSAYPTITNCSSTANGISGISIENTSSPTIIDCSERNNTMHGIQISSSSPITITGSISAGNCQMGIAVFGTSNAEFLNCSSSNNLYNGVTTCNDSAPIFKNCTFSNNTYHGAQVQDSAGPRFTSCTFSGNNYHGAAVYSNSTAVFADCTLIDNDLCGVAMWGTAPPDISNCIISKNNNTGLTIMDQSSPHLDGLYLSGNGGQNVWVTSTAPVILANSTLAGGSSCDIMLSNNSRLTLLNTTYTKQALLTGNSQLNVEWYLTFAVFDRAKNPVPGAKVSGTGMNGSLASAVVSGPDGVARNLVATEFIQNSSDSICEFTNFSPYNFTVDKDGETNVTEDFPVSRSLSWRLYFDYYPRIGPLPDIPVIEDQPRALNLTPYLSDPDNPPSMLGFTVDRDYVFVDNASQHLDICCPTAIGSDTITITVSDGLKSSNQTLFITVTPVNDPPKCIVNIPDQMVYEDQTLDINLTDYFWDEESGSQLTFTCNREEIAIDNELRQASWTPGEGNSSLEGVVFTAFDGHLTGDSNEFNITFIPVNDPPIYLGGLEGTTVLEHKNWTIDLRKYFSDEENAEGMIFESNSSEIVINSITHMALWTPSGNVSYSIEVVFTAHDAANYSMSVSSDLITLKYQPVNDPPVYLGKLTNVRLKLGEEWNKTLEDQFRDEDTEVLRFSVNNPNVKIIEASKTRHYAVWKPNEYSTDINGLVFTAYDGNTYVKSAPIDITFEAPGEPGGSSQITRIIQSIPWYIYVLLPVGILGGLAAFYSYRKVKYGKYEVEQIFLVYNDGRLLAHKSKKPLEEGGEDIISGMLTALQGFIRESLKDEKQGELDEMKYGDLKIAIERGQKVYLAVFLSGYITEVLRDAMKGVLDNVDKEFGEVLQSWDGTVAKLKGVKVYLDELMGEKKVVRKESKPPAPSVPAPEPVSTKKILQRVIAQLPSGAPGEEVTLKSELEFYQGFLRLKVAVKNGMPMNITRAAIALIYNDQALRLDHIEPEYERSGTQVIMGVLDPGEKKTAAFYLDPQICTESHIEGVLTYKDARGNLETLQMARKLASVVCPILYTDENINTAMLKRMCAEELDKKDAKVFTIPAGLEVQKTFEIGKAAVEHHDVRLVREFSAEEPYRGEAWYYGKAKGREDKMVIRVRVMEDRRLLEFFVASTSTLMLTGLLAELKSDLNKELAARKVEGILSQVTDAEAVRQMISESTLLEKAPEGGDKPG